MKAKLIRRLIQFAAIVFLIWDFVHRWKGLEVGDLFLLGTVAAFFIAYWGINVKFPQPEIRCRIYGKLMLVLIILLLFDAALCIINFNHSTTEWAAWLFTPAALCLVMSYSLREEYAELFRRSSNRQKRTLQRFNSPHS